MSKKRKAHKSGRDASMNVQENVQRAAEVFGRYGDEICAMIRFQVKDESRIGDIFQNLFLSLVDNPIPEEISNVRGYLYRAVTNDVIDTSRRVKSYENRIARYAQYQQTVAVTRNPEDAVIEMEEIQKLYSLVEEHLPRCESQAVTMTYKDDLNTEEVADEMGVNRRTVSRYLCVGLKKVREVLSQEEGCMEGQADGACRF